MQDHGQYYDAFQIRSADLRHRADADRLARQALAGRRRRRHHEEAEARVSRLRARFARAA